MLDFCRRLANRLYQYKFALWLLALIAIAVFLSSIFLSKNDIYTLGSIALLLWILFLISFSHVFSSPLPNIDRTAPFFYRLLARAKRGLFWILVVLMIALFGIVSFMSLRTVSVLF